MAGRMATEVEWPKKPRDIQQNSKKNRIFWTRGNWEPSTNCKASFWKLIFLWNILSAVCKRKYIKPACISYEPSNL